MELAVISIPVYKRIDHLKKCIESLKKNQLAKESIIYIYSDFPVNNDIESVFELREYIKTIDGFKRVIIKEQTENKNLGNIIESIEEPLKIHGKIIYLEEDLEVATNFLDLMNEALNFYLEDELVFSVSGYSLPCFNNQNSISFKASFSFTAWGCGLWYSKYLNYKQYIDNRNILTRLNESLLLKLKFIKNHSLHQYLHYKDKTKLNKLTPDLSIGFYIWNENKVQIFPSQTIVSTNGFDGSGWHCGVDNKFNSQLTNEIPLSSVEFPNSFYSRDSKINFNKIKEFHNLNLLLDAKSLIKYFLKKLRIRK